MSALSEQADPAAKRRPSDPIPIHIWVTPEGGHWSALIEEFNVVGAGDRPEAAIAQACEMLEDYLMLSERDGLSIDEARRPISRRWKAELQAKLLLSRVTAAVMSKRPRPARRVSAVPRHC